MSGTSTFPPTGPTSLQTIIRSYLYKQYEDDDDLQTFVASQNFLAQKWLDDFNSLNLPIWSLLSGDLLDWVAWGLYGIRRPVLSYQKPGPTGAGVGPYATMPYNTLDYAGGRLHPANTNPITYLTVTDDVFRRILTWHLYKGDGQQFNTRWLKRRVHRFLNGVDGLLIPEDNTYDVSISASGTAITITVTANEIGTVFQYAVQDGVLALPFQFSYDVQPINLVVPSGMTGRIRPTASIRSKTILLGLLGSSVGATTRFAGRLLYVPAPIPPPAGALVATSDVRADFYVKTAAGTVAWPTASEIDATAGIQASITVLHTGSMGGVLAATAG